MSQTSYYFLIFFSIALAMFDNYFVDTYLVQFFIYIVIAAMMLQVLIQAWVQDRERDDYNYDRQLKLQNLILDKKLQDK